MNDQFAKAIARAPKARKAGGGDGSDWTRYCPHKPHPRQAEFLALDCMEAGFGGAAGGGKSDALLMAALMFVDEPGYAALLLRRTYQDLALPGAIMDRSHEWLGSSDASWNGTDKRWTFPSGASLSFGYLDTDRDRYRYASAEFQFVGFDELTQFPETWYRFLFSRLRRKLGVKAPLRMRSATNPGGIGHEWVRRRFIVAKEGPPFIPSKLEDNPSLNADEYRAALERLDPTTRKQLLDGVWVRDSGGLVYAFDEERNTVALADGASTFDYHLLALDFGFTDATGFVILGWRKHSQTVFVLSSFKVRGKTPSDIGEMVKKLEDAYHFDTIVGDVGGLGKAYAEEARKRFHVPIEPAEKKNKRGYIDLLNGALTKGDLLLVKDANDDLVTELLELPWNEDRSKEVDGFDNHLTDALLYGWRRSTAYGEGPADEGPPKMGTKAWEATEETRVVERFDREKKREWWEKDLDDQWYEEEDQ